MTRFTFPMTKNVVNCALISVLPQQNNKYVEDTEIYLQKMGMPDGDGLEIKRSIKEHVNLII